MKKGARHLMRLALVAMLIQVACPLFLSVCTLNNEFQVVDTKLSLHAEKHSVNAPTLLKEKEESETENRDFEVAFVALIDFTDHASTLSRHHNSKIIPFLFFNRIDHRPPLFTLHSVFLI
jgi:hypothetical protein